MALSSKHPLYSRFLPEWELMRDSYRGERSVKEKGALYLPATSGMLLDNANVVGSAGWNAYQAYKTRAVFHDFVARAVEWAIGVMWSKPPEIELPTQLEDLLEHATPNGESLEQLLRRINIEQLIMGRLGLLADMPKVPNPEKPLPYLATYQAETIINWDAGKIGDQNDPGLDMLVLDESENIRDGGFEWKLQEKYRALILGSLTENEGSAGKVAYRAGVFEGANYVEDDLIEPSVRGKTLQRIPFQFINSKDLVPTPDDPPLLGLARLAMTIYRGEADYRQALFMQAQDTLVVIGGDEEKAYRIGAGATITVKEGGDAKFIGCNSTGLPEMRSALENDKSQAKEMAGHLVEKSSQKESGDALNIRVGAQTATLNQIARTGAEGLKRQLRTIAEWIGADPDAVIVEPCLDFSDDVLTGKDLIDMMTAKTMGAPISLKSIHNNMVDGGLTELSMEDELEEIAGEEPLVAGGPGTVTDPNDPNYDPNKDPNYDPLTDPESPQSKKAAEDKEDDHAKAKDLIVAKEKAKPKPKVPAKKKG